MIKPRQRYRSKLTKKNGIPQYQYIVLTKFQDLNGKIVFAIYYPGSGHIDEVSQQELIVDPDILIQEADEKLKDLL